MERKIARFKQYPKIVGGRYGLGFARDFHTKSLEQLMEMLGGPTSERQFILYEALRKGADIQTLYERTYLKPWFFEQMKELVELEQEILRHKGKRLPDELLVKAKKDGFADRYLSKLLGIPERAQVVYCLPLGYPRGRFGPVRRKPLEEVVSADRWGNVPGWARLD